MDNEYKTTPFDAQLQSHDLQILKTVLPYMEWKQQKTLAVLIKYMELQRTANVFSSETPSISICEIKDGSEKTMQMLSDISDVCNEKERESIDMIINMLQMFSTYEVLFS